MGVAVRVCLLGGVTALRSKEHVLNVWVPRCGHAVEEGASTAGVKGAGGLQRPLDLEEDVFHL